MKNLEKLARIIIKNKAKNILIHTIPRTPLWLVCQKIEINKWHLTLLNPDHSTIYRLGTVNSKTHIDLWTNLIKLEIEHKATQEKRAKIYKIFIKNYAKKHNQP
jgi:hypothetical protein